MGRLLVHDPTFYRSVLRIAVPVVLQSLISMGVNMTGTIMLGAYGETQISACSLATEFINIFMIFCFGFGGGVAVLTAQYWGARDIVSLKKVVIIMLRLVLFLAVVFTLFACLIPKTIISIFSPEEHIIQKGMEYLMISAAVFPLMGITLTLTSVLRSIHQVRLPLIATTTIFLINIFLNWVFIYGNLGAPEMQIAGAALALLIARIVETLIIGGYVLFLENNIRLRIYDLFQHVERKFWKLYMKYAMPVVVSDAFLAFGNSAISIIMGHIGSSFVAANAIVMQVVRLATVFNTGISNSSSILTGNTLGTGDREKAYQQGKTFISLGACIGFFACSLTLIATPFVIGIFTITEETLALCNQLMYAVALMVVFQTIENVMTKGVLRGGGDTRFLMVADVLFLWVASVPLGYLAGLVFNLPIFWVYVALRIDAVIKSIWCLCRFLSKKWIRVVSTDSVAAVESPPSETNGLSHPHAISHCSDRHSDQK